VRSSVVVAEAVVVMVVVVVVAVVVDATSGLGSSESIIPSLSVSCWLGFVPMVASKQSSQPSPSVSGQAVVVGIDVGMVVVAVVVVAVVAVVGVGGALHWAVISSGASAENDHSA